MWMLLGVVVAYGFAIHVYRVRYEPRWKGERFSWTIVQREAGAWLTPRASYRVIQIGRGPLWLRRRFAHVRVGLDKGPRIALRMKSRGWLDLIAGWVGLSVACKFGCPVVDKRVYVVTDEARICGMLQKVPAMTDIVARILDACERHHMRFRGLRMSRNRVWVDLRPRRVQETYNPYPVALDVVPLLDEFVTTVRASLGRGASKIKDANEWIAAVIVGISTSLLITGVLLFLIHDWVQGGTVILDYGRLHAYAVGAALVMVGGGVIATLGFMGRSARTHIVLMELVTAGAFGAYVFAATVGWHANVELDWSRATEHHVLVMDKHRRTRNAGRGPTEYTLTVQNREWGGGARRIEVSGATFRRVNRGDGLVVEERRGALRIPWYRSRPSEAPLEVGATPR